MTHDRESFVYLQKEIDVLCFWQFAKLEDEHEVISMMPWFGSFKTFPVVIPVYMGKSDDKGFEVSIKKGEKVHSWGVCEGRLGPHTIAGYANPFLAIIFNFAIYSLFCALCAAVALAFLNDHSFLYYFGASMLLFCMGCTLLIILVGTFFFGNARRGYHSVEHMSIALLKMGLEPNAENFRKLPKLTVYCGSSHITMVNILLAVVGWSIMEGYTAIALSLTGIIVFLYDGNLAVWATKRLPSWSIISIVKKSALTVISRVQFLLFGIVSFCCVIPSLIQYTLLLGKPDEKKIQEAVMLTRHVNEQYIKLR